MDLRRWAGTALLCSLAYACGVDGTSNADCNTLIALKNKCASVQIRGLDASNCAAILFFTPARCQTALHTYLGCATEKTCSALADPNTCLGEEQALQIACQTANATITTGVDGNSQTRPRSTYTSAAK